MARFWFRPKRFGYGATPTNWQGWAATAAFAVGLVYVVFEFNRSIELARTGAIAAWMIAAYVASAAVLVVGFVRFAEYKTNGKWKWRWGDGD